ncbi:MAG: glutaminyl-peptide cyclotransferase [Gemmatimonadetes bacterium]|jgi:glutaminyl-peptide cyclotransferase|nr:glutaminyl-peptide cyclotransferase [Gemmatimonadota bacterium]MBT6149524.1 glutaminyl-peptide cyclotransferase [Gemmatimonadota bacterium]MBT7860498.1 glutaminyl-peptide cyclotransferase [Gemmatimonadota bacterium]
MHRIHREIAYAACLLILALGACNGSDPVDVDGSHDDANPPEEPQGIARYTYRIVNVFPHDPDAWTQGLVFDAGLLLEGTGGGVRLARLPDLPPSSLREVEIETGRVLRQVLLDEQLFGEGIALWGERIFQLTWKSQVGLTYDRDSFTAGDGFTYASEGWGLTHDGQQLIMSDGSASITFRNPDTFAETGRIEVSAEGQSIRNLNELEYVEGEIWANIWGTQIIAQIDPATGAVVGWIDLTGLLTSRERAGADVLNGIAYDPATGRIFVTGKLWPWLFQIELVAA